MPFTPVTFTDGVTPLNKAAFDGVQAGVIAAERTEYKGVANGYASLGADGKVPAAQMPITAYATTLPGSPVDGQEAILVDSLTAPTYVWRFRYNAGSISAYKWELVGGSPKVGIGGTITNSTGATLSPLSGGPNVAVPRAGDYLVRMGIFMQNQSGFAGAYNLQAQVFKAAGTVAIGPYVQIVASATYAGGDVSGIAINTLAASDSLNINVAGSAAAGSSYNTGRIEITPVRVS